MTCIPIPKLHPAKETRRARVKLECSTQEYAEFGPHFPSPRENAGPLCVVPHHCITPLSMLLLLTIIGLLCACHTTGHPSARKSDPTPTPTTSRQYPTDFQGYPFGTPLSGVRGLLRRSSNIAEGSPGKVTDIRGGCDQYDKNGRCVRAHVNQTSEGGGSYALAQYYSTLQEKPPFPGTGVEAIQIEYYFCAHSTGSLPDTLSSLLTICGGQYGFRSDTVADQRAREAHNAEQISVIEQELQRVSPNDPAHDRLLGYLRETRIQQAEYESPQERVTTWLISRFGEPIGYKRRPQIRVQSGDVEIVTPNPPHPEFVVYRWCEVSPWRLAPACPASITLACELKTSGWCTVIIATSLVYGFTYAEYELCNKRFAWLYQLLYVDSHQFTMKPQLQGTECGALTHRVESRPLSKKETQQFDTDTRSGAPLTNATQHSAADDP